MPIPIFNSVASFFLKRRISQIELFKDYFKTDSEIVKFNYFRESQIESVKSASLKKSDTIEGKLIGVKGQYLIFEDSTVFNVRSNEGHTVDITIT